MRGKQLIIYRFYRFNRITPAYAGKTSRTRRADVQAEDHPRVCGENACANNLVRDTLGSPPRMRGKQC
mgnify:CR=1 FL=1